MASINQADGAGKIEIGGQAFPVSYHVIARDGTESGKRSVHVEVSLPRDWLVEKGFEREAVLIRENDTRTQIHAAESVDEADPISVVLQSETVDTGDENALIESFPELSV